MRARELFEQRNTSWQRKPISIEDAKTLILRDCKKAWAAYQKNIMAYRGIHVDKRAPCYQGQTGQDRIPQSSSSELQKLVDQALRDQLGPDAAVRSNSIFVIGSYTAAAEYDQNNQPYVFFPADTASFTWSKKYDDLVLDTIGSDKWFTFFPLSNLDSYNKFVDLLNQRNISASSNPVIEMSAELTLNENRSDIRLRNIVAQLQQQPASVQDAATESGFWEQLVSLQNQFDKNFLPNLIKLNLAQFEPDLFIEKFQPQTDDWAKAVKSRNEIYVKGSYVLVQEPAMLF